MEKPLVPDGPTERATGVAVKPELRTPIDLVGQIVAGSYRVERRIGAGGMGVVYEAIQVETGRVVALKCIHPALVADVSATRRFLQEIRAASRIRHAHVVEILDSGETSEGAPCVVMEFLEGEDLAAYVQRNGPLPWRRVASVVAQVADALDAAHQLGIVHRDIKPANCLRTSRTGEKDRIKVLDFGLARLSPDLHTQDESMTSTGVILGTPGYIAPEVFRGFRADARSDIYALGVMAYRLLKDELPPFKISNDALAGIPSQFQVVVRKCLSHDPDDRYPRAGLVRDEIRRILAVPAEGPTVAASRAVPPVAVGYATQQRRAMFAIVAAVVLLVSAAYAGVRAERDRQESGAVRIAEAPAEPSPVEPGPKKKGGWIPAKLGDAMRPEVPSSPLTVVWNFETDPVGAMVTIEQGPPEVLAALAPQLEGKVTPLRLVVPYDLQERLQVTVTHSGYKPSKRSLIPMNNENIIIEMQPESRPRRPPR